MNTQLVHLNTWLFSCDHCWQLKAGVSRTLGKLLKWQFLFLVTNQNTLFCLFVWSSFTGTNKGQLVKTMYSNTEKILNRPAAGLRRVTNCCCKYYSGRSKGEAADGHRLEGWPLPAGCRAPSPRIAAVLGSLQSAASLALCDPQGDGLGRRTSRTWLLTRWHSNLPPLVREKSAKTRCFFSLFFFFYLWHFPEGPLQRLRHQHSCLGIKLSKKMRFFFFLV